LGFIGAHSGFFDLIIYIYEILMDSVREKTSASNELICKEEKAEFLIAQIVTTNKE